MALCKQTGLPPTSDVAIHGVGGAKNVRERESAHLNSCQYRSGCGGFGEREGRWGMLHYWFI